jgi:triosephosphate isomerase
MYRELEITPPFFAVGPKAYVYGEDLLRLAQYADKISQRYNVQIIFTPQYVDIPLLAQQTERILVFAQHMDALRPGRGVGSVLPEALKAAGASGAMLNHAEKSLSLDEIEGAIQRADEVGLASMVCAATLEEAAAIAHMGPNIILAESPALIGTGKRQAEDQLAIPKINELVWSINPEIRVLHGAGIGSGQDVYDIIMAGAQAAGSSSGILLADNPRQMLEDMVEATRRAWDQRVPG